MSTLTLKIPEGILSAIRQSAEEAGVSVDQFVSSAVGEKLASWRRAAGSYLFRPIVPAPRPFATSAPLR